MDQPICRQGQAVRDDFLEERIRIELEILAYLYEHPAARDTVEGIAEWWIAERMIQKQSRDVKEAIADLVRKGFVIERQMNGSRCVYQINPEMSQEILTWVQQRSESDKKDHFKKSG